MAFRLYVWDKLLFRSNEEVAEGVNLALVIEKGAVGRNWEELGGTGKNWEELGGTGRNRMKQSLPVVACMISS